MRTSIKLPVTVSLLAIPAFASAAEKADAASAFGNPLFNTMLATIIVLAIVILALAGALRNLIGSDFYVEKLRQAAASGKTKATMVTLLIFASHAVMAQGKPAVPAPDTIGGMEQAVFYTMAVTIAAELLVLGVLLRMFRRITSGPAVKRAVAVKKSKPILDKINKTVSIEEEESITLDHVYDGIRELDNDLPPWWKYGFYLTVVVAVIYMIGYHVTDSLPLQKEEYQTSLKQAEAEVAKYMKTSANNVDESTVKLLTEKADLETGKELYVGACAACHGRAGEGGVGPNLTDDYWLHSGGVKDIFKTIKYGWPDKGMKSWKDDFSPIQIAQMTSYIKSLRGSNPANAKEKQGDLYTEETPAAADSTQKLTSQLLKQ